MKTPVKLAVYGTLRRGGPANGFLRGAKYIRQGLVLGSIYDLGAFPGYKGKQANGTPVVVDLYEIDSPELLTAVDSYEGYRPGKPEESLYNRVRVLTCDKTPEWVEIYEYNGELDPSSKINSGDWFKS